MRGDKKSNYPVLALSSGKNEYAVTDSVFFYISQVCTRGLALDFSPLGVVVVLVVVVGF